MAVALLAVPATRRADTRGRSGLSLDSPILAANPARGSPPSADRRLPKGPPCGCAADRPWTAPANAGSSTMIGESRLSGCRQARGGVLEAIVAPERLATD